MLKTNQKNFNIYIIDKIELKQLTNKKAMGKICDMCNKEVNTLYYIPVLHYVVCKDCYKEWIRTATYHEEDESYIQEKEQWIENLAKELDISVFTLF